MSILQALSDLEKIRRRIAIAALTQSGVGYGAFTVLDHMDRYDLTRATDIARSVDVSNPNIVNLLQRMEEGGLIRRAPDPEDRRASTIWMTDTGRSRLKRGRKVMDRLEALITEGIDPEPLTVIRSVANRMSRNLTEASHALIQDLMTPNRSTRTDQDPGKGLRKREGPETRDTGSERVPHLPEGTRRLESPSPQGAGDAHEYLKRLEKSFYDALRFHPHFSLSQIRLILKVQENEKPVMMRYLVDELGYDYQKMAALFAILSDGRGEQEGKEFLKRVKGKDRTEKLIRITDKGRQLCDVLGSAFPNAESPLGLVGLMGDRLAEAAPKLRLSSAVIFLRLVINDRTEMGGLSSAKSLFKDRAVIDVARHLKSLSEAGLLDRMTDSLNAEMVLPTLSERGRSLLSDLDDLSLQMVPDRTDDVEAHDIAEPSPCL